MNESCPFEHFIYCRLEHTQQNNIYYYFMYMDVLPECMLCTKFANDAHGGQKRAQIP